MQANLTNASPLRSTASDLAASSLMLTHPLASQAAPAAVESSELLQGQKAVAIRHNGSVYRLQATKLGKLILTK
ncbi:MAG: hemin uptake protein HemP [Gammaproteobacteria bacterium]|jgi:hemin uptake protein HemP|nr:hemin uptake protein HemP [Acidovorax sp. JG5]MBU4424980.1 hemin uptake protein HemP [Gammaproteobacteria bacterium]